MPWNVALKSALIGAERRDMYEKSSDLINLGNLSSVSLFWDFHPTGEFFTQLETLPLPILPMKDYKELVAEKRDFYLNVDLCWVFKQCWLRTGLH